MPILNRVAEFAPEITEWRHHLHTDPELLYDVHRTAAFVAEKLEAFGCDEIATGIGCTGVVGVVEGRRESSSRAIGLRADMDALPIEEATDLPYRSKSPGKMHACGHDGHTAMLLGAAKYLTETRNFGGRAVLIFQPAEEGGAGAKAMIDDGLMSRFGIEQVYGMHNRPGLPVGRFAIRKGHVHAAMDEFEIAIEGKGGHAAKPHRCVDPVWVGAQIVNAVQSIVSRNVDPLEAAVISITTCNAGNAFNVISQTAILGGTARTFDASVRDLVETRLGEMVEAITSAHGARGTMTYRRLYPSVCNHDAPTEFAAAVASDVAGPAQVDTDMAPDMGAEDFAFMLEDRPGAIIFLGNGDSADNHHPAFDFADDAIPYGTSYWSRLVEIAMPA